MRFFNTSLIALAVALAITGCNGSKSSDTSSSSTTTSSDQTTSAPAANSGATTGGNEMPTYPGATVQASGTGSNMGTTATGKVLTTTDSFDTVYAWYQKNTPAGSEKSHVESPVQSAVFMVGDPSSGQNSVTITTQGGKTVITIAKVKM
ncbi:MAG: hypothetical protein JO078_13190 [Candidatus Eremiobacteraeota bacterium]|nr:hypothetical protein [Candidatus Eremiobacteraeota bacterium]MBV9056727.1 hypothetical protein [Candidatus Eremiobacteraeota bacterium]MBV9701058.1 hypothetical protein [Candidatus Eremiobacteraeota bacterium]